MSLSRDEQASKLALIERLESLAELGQWREGVRLQQERGLDRPFPGEAAALAERERELKGGRR